MVRVFPSCMLSTPGAGETQGHTHPPRSTSSTLFIPEPTLPSPFTFTKGVPPVAATLGVVYPTLELFLESCDLSSGEGSEDSSHLSRVREDYCLRLL